MLFQLYWNIDRRKKINFLQEKVSCQENSNKFTCLSIQKIVKINIIIKILLNIIYPSRVRRCWLLLVLDTIYEAQGAWKLSEPTGTFWKKLLPQVLDKLCFSLKPPLPPLWDFLFAILWVASPQITGSVCFPIHLFLLSFFFHHFYSFLFPFSFYFSLFPHSLRSFLTISLFHYSLFLIFLFYFICCISHIIFIPAVYLDVPIIDYFSISLNILCSIGYNTYLIWTMYIILDSYKQMHN